MSAFEFYFSFYGLLLGLSVAQVASGIGRAIVMRRESRLGWLTPLISLFVAVDIASFWMWAWMSREVIQVTYASLYMGLAIALAYFIAASLLFPVREGDWEDLDRHYWANKKLVMLGVGAANAIVIAEAAIHRGVPFQTVLAWTLQLLYWLPLAVMLVSRKKLVDGACLFVLIGGYAVAAVVQ
jgi:hypothetical protein